MIYRILKTFQNTFFKRTVKCSNISSFVKHNIKLDGGVFGLKCKRACFAAIFCFLELGICPPRRPI